MTVLGLDLGHTNCVMAVPGRVRLAADYPGAHVYPEGCYLPEMDVTIIPSPQGELNFPSVLYTPAEGPAQYICGREALEKLYEGEEPLRGFLRYLGTATVLKQPGGVLSPVEAMEVFLRYLKECAVQALGEPVDRAVFTHPPDFSLVQLDALRQAAMAAGFEVSLPEQTLPSPIAAFLGCPSFSARERLLVLVYAWGGQTFHATLLEKGPDGLKILSLEGDNFLGGVDLDRKLAHWLIDQVTSRYRVSLEDHTTPVGRAIWYRLMKAAEDLKIRFSSTREGEKVTEVRLDFLLDDQENPFTVCMDRQMVAELLYPEFEQTLELCLRCLGRVGVKAVELDAVLLAGGSTVLINHYLANHFPADILRGYDDFTMAVGAASFARCLSPRSVQQSDLDYDELELIEDSWLLPWPLFVGTAGACISFDEGLPLPSKILEREFDILRDGSELTLDIFRGDELAAKMNISGIPPGARDSGKVLIRVCVTEKYELRGEAIFMSADTGEEVYRTPVKVTIPTTHLRSV